MTEGRPINIPNPDPSVLTTEQMLREIEHVKELLELSITNNENNVRERLARLEATIAEPNTDNKYFERVMQEQERARKMADEEREKTAQTLHKATTAQISSGDEALLLHIKAQTATIDALERSGDLQREASEKAIMKAEASNEKRFEAVNEFRAQLSDQSKTFLPRELFDQALHEIRGRYEILQGRAEANANRIIEIESTSKGAKENLTGLYAAVAALGLIITIGISAVLAFNN